MNDPQRTWCERLAHPDSELGPLETAYRRATFQADVKQLKIVLGILAAAMFFLLVSDYQLFGWSASLWRLALVRAALVVIPLIGLYFIKRVTSYELRDRFILGIVLVSCGLHVYVGSTRPPTLAHIDLLFILISIYLIVPNRFYYRLLPALGFSAGALGVFLFYRPDNGLGDALAIGTGLIFGNLLGVLISQQLYQYRRDQFRARHEERLARQEVERLAALLREANARLEEKVRDRTAKLAESNAALAKANRQLQELDRLKSAFLGVITHELRTPFVNIALSLALLERHGLERLLPEQREQFQELTAGVQSAQLMIDNLIKFATLISKQGELRLTSVDLRVVVERALMPLKLQSDRKGLTLAVQLPADLPSVHGDEERLAEVVYHLVHNAIKFTAAGGQISLRGWVAVNDN